MILYRPVGLKELELIAASGWREFPPRLFWQPIFYPVITQEYARRICVDWNAKEAESGRAGFVTRFEIDDALAKPFITPALTPPLSHTRGDCLRDGGVGCVRERKKDEGHESEP